MLLMLPVVALLTLAGCGGEEGDTVPPSFTLDQGVFRTPTQDSEILLEGEVEAGSTVEAFLAGEQIPSGQISVTANRWSVTISNLVVGTNVIEVRATDDTGNNQSLALVIVREVVTVEQFVTPTPDGVQTVSGRVAPGNSVTVTISDTAVLDEPASVSGGAWSINVPVLPAGDYTLTATASDGSSASVALKVAEGTPQLVIGPFRVETNIDNQSFSGSFSGTSITASLNGQSATDITPATGVDWTYPASGLEIGENVLVFTVTAGDGTQAFGATSILRKL